MNTKLRERFAKLKPGVAAGARARLHPGGDGQAREVLGLAWPIVVAMLGDAAMGVVDTTLVGALGPAALAGVGLALTALFVGYTVVFGLMRAVKIRTAYAVGEGREDEGVRAAVAGALLGAAVGLAVLLLSRDGRWIFVAMGADAALVGPATEFFRAHGLGAPALGVTVALVQHLQGRGDTRTPMLTGLAANALNAALAYALIHGHAGLPALGVAGAGLATSLSVAAQAIALSFWVWRGARGRLALGPLGPSLREVLSLGAPTAAQFGLETLAFTTFTALLGSIAAAELAAHQIALSLLRACFLPGIAVAEAASVLVGRALGEGRPDRADRAVRAGLWIAAGFMAFTSVGLGLASPRVLGLFTADAEVARIAARLLWVAALFETVDAVTIVLRGALRGAKDVRFVAVVGIAASWVCVPSAAWWLGKRLGWGAVGGWLGFVGETTIAASLLAWRWRTAPFRRSGRRRLTGRLAAGLEAS
ncbi:MAG: MATE family efflux transporter [Polyangiaceae bacterium]|nr:MATE family efflux transporter [Polyangiaceae bacterium]